MWVQGCDSVKFHLKLCQPQCRPRLNWMLRVECGFWGIPLHQLNVQCCCRQKLLYEWRDGKRVYNISARDKCLNSMTIFYELSAGRWCSSGTWSVIVTNFIQLFMCSVFPGEAQMRCSGMWKCFINFVGDDFEFVFLFSGDSLCRSICWIWNPVDVDCVCEFVCFRIEQRRRIDCCKSISCSWYIHHGYWKVRQTNHVFCMKIQIQILSIPLHIWFNVQRDLIWLWFCSRIRSIPG